MLWNFTPIVIFVLWHMCNTIVCDWLMFVKLKKTQNPLVRLWTFLLNRESDEWINDVMKLYLVVFVAALQSWHSWLWVMPQMSFFSFFCCCWNKPTNLDGSLPVNKVNLIHMKENEWIKMILWNLIQLNFACPTTVRHSQAVLKYMTHDWTLQLPGKVPFPPLPLKRMLTRGGEPDGWLTPVQVHHPWGHTSEEVAKPR